jgi:hypothetical protein
VRRGSSASSLAAAAAGVPSEKAPLLDGAVLWSGHGRRGSAGGGGGERRGSMGGSLHGFKGNGLGRTAGEHACMAHLKSAA